MTEQNVFDFPQIDLKHSNESELKKWAYPAKNIQKLFAPPEREHPADKLRGLLRERFSNRKQHPEKSFVITAGAYDAFNASLLTRLEFDAIYASGWQLAVAHNMYPDIGIYPSHMMVDLVRELVRGVEGTRDSVFYDQQELLPSPPIFADIEAGFGGPTQTFTLTRELIRAGVAGVHLEDQDPAERTCGHVVAHHGAKRQKVLVHTHKWLEKMIAVKAAAYASGIPIVIIARTDAADGAVPGENRADGVSHAVERALEAASLGVDVIWPEFNDTTLESPQKFAEGVHKYYPNQMLGFNLSPSLHWGKAKQEGKLITNAQLGALGFTLQFSTLLSFRTTGMAMEHRLKAFRKTGLEALADLQLHELEHPENEPESRMHQKFAGTDRWLTLEQIAKANNSQN